MRAERSALGKVAFVPTMGALHEGHLKLIEEARLLADSVVVSIFVNPTQFGPNDDFAAYPRTEERDLDLAGARGADVAFVPAADEIYRSQSATVKVTGVSDLWEGVSRPGHFDGVATVVLKLFGIVQPSVAVFGLKDLQQCAVVRAMVESLDVPVDLSFVETVRDANGLALSSRNAYFSDEQRAQASLLYKTLIECSKEISSDPTSASTLISVATARLTSLDFQVEYLACVSPKTMRGADEDLQDARLICAARFCGVRLIDNVKVVL